MTQAERERQALLRAQMEEITQVVGILERFNGVPFVEVGVRGVRTGTGIELATTEPTPDAPALEPSPYVFVPISAGQFDLLKQSYTALKDSVFGARPMELNRGPERAANDLEWRMVA